MIELKGITKVYRSGRTQVKALRGIDLSIKEGEFVAVVGASGSGKSTLMNILGCLDKPTSGKYMLDGSDVALASKRALADIRNRRIGFVFQDFNLLGNMSALKNVEMPLIFRGYSPEERYELAAKALDAVGLSHRLEHLPKELSGGQRQRVAIARALVGKPSVILADEPTGNLDSKSGNDILKMLCELNESGRTIVLITHDPSVALRAGRSVTISDGKII